MRIVKSDEVIYEMTLNTAAWRSPVKVDDQNIFESSIKKSHMQVQALATPHL